MYFTVELELMLEELDVNHARDKVMRLVSLLEKVGVPVTYAALDPYDENPDLHPAALHSTATH